MTRRFPQSLFFLALALSFLTSCGSDLESRFAPAPAAFGSINRVTIIADSSLWLSGAEDSAAFFFQAPYIILPAPEPIFDVYHIEPDRLAAQPPFRELRNYIVMADLSDLDSPTAEMVLRDLSDAKLREVKETGFATAVARNKWATGQQLIYLMGNSREELFAGMSKVHPAVVDRIVEREAERFKATTYFRGIDRVLSGHIQDKTGLLIDVPGGYEQVPLEAEDFIWMRKQLRKGSINFVATRVPYDNDGQLSREGLKAIRNQLGREFISSTLDSTYMVINDVDLPLFIETINVNGAYALEGRGIWEMENDFQGGPFISYLINDTTNRNLILVDGFVLAPGEDKRELMGEIESVLATSRVQ